MSDPKSPQPSSDALRARLAQLELENRLRLQQIQLADGTPAVKETPRRGFGSAQGIAHLRHTEHQRRGPTPPTPPSPPPPPGKFGGVRLTPPLPGIIESLASSNEREAAFAFPASLASAPSTSPESQVPPVYGVAPKPPTAGQQPAPSGAMPSGRPMPSDVTPKTSPIAEAPSDVGSSVPATAPFDANKGKVIGDRAIAKKPLPAIYYATVKAAEQTKAVVPEPSKKVAASGPIVVPQGSEVVRETQAEAKTLPRLKRFKNPTLATPAEKDQEN